MYYGETIFTQSLSWLSHPKKISSSLSIVPEKYNLSGGDTHFAKKCVTI